MPVGVDPMDAEVARSTKQMKTVQLAFLNCLPPLQESRQ